MVDFLCKSNKFNSNPMVIQIYKKAKEYILSVYNEEMISSLLKELNAKNLKFSNEEK